MCYPFDIPECHEFTDKRPELIAEEKKKVFKIINNSRHKLCKIRIDNCVIKSGRTCDFLILDCTSKIAYFTELKGSALKDASEQLYMSIDKLRSKVSSYRIKAVAVLSKTNTHDLRSSKYVNLERLIKKMGGIPATDILRKNKLLEITT